MAGKSKEQQEKEFWEEWKVKLTQLFKKKEKRKELEEKSKEIESQEKEGYIKFIYNYTELYGVRETARRLEEAGIFKINPSNLSQIRQGNIENLAGVQYLENLSKAMSELNSEKDEKNK